MAKYTRNKLSDPDVRHAKPKDKKYPLRDGGALYCEVLPTGTKTWRYDYRIHGKQKTYTIGQYPTIGLSEARVLRDDAKQQVKNGIDPSLQKQIEKKAKLENSFEAIAETWLEKYISNMSESHQKRTEGFLTRDAYPYLAKREISILEAPDIIPVIEEVANRGAVDSAKRLKGVIQQVFDFALVHGKVSRNPVKDINLTLLLPKTIKKHYAAITDPVELGEFLRDCNAYHGTYSVRSALILAPMVMLRPTELAHAEWSEFDFESKIWVLPANRRKLPTHLKKANSESDVHLIPLSDQAVKLLKEAHQYSGRSKYVFPAPRDRKKPMCPDSIRMAMRRMGYDTDTMTTHGFRGVASTFLNTLKYRKDAIEAQLAHKDKNEVRSSYNHADYIEERREMLQDWSNYLDSLKQGADVVPIKHHLKAL